MSNPVTLLLNHTHSADTLRCHGYYFPPTDPAALAHAKTTDGYLAADFAAAPTSTNQPRRRRRRPSSSPRHHRRAAVAIDCEFVGVRHPHHPRETSELARLSAVDVLTGEGLIDTYVDPDQRISDWRTRWSGITRADMARARKEGRMLRGGWRAARAALFRFVGEETVIVGHALGNDLKALRVVPGRVVDSSVLAAAAWRSGYPWCSERRRQVGLGNLGWGLFGEQIQRPAPHCCLEDARAARRVVVWCVSDMRRLAEWARRGSTTEWTEDEGEGEDVPDLEGIECSAESGGLLLW